MLLFFIDQLTCCTWQAQFVMEYELQGEHCCVANL